METKKKKTDLDQDTLRFAHELEDKLLPMMGNCGLWNEEVPATMERKRNLLFVIAERQAKLKKQVEWLHQQQEYYRQLQEDV